MDKNGSFKLKLIFPCWCPRTFKHIPHGMGVLAAFLRNNNYRVEQEDLHIKFDCHGHYFFPLNFKMVIYTSEFIEEVRRILETGTFKCRLGLIIDKLLDSLCLDKFNLIGFSINTDLQLYFALLFSRRIKQNIGIPIVFGGSFVTLYGHLYSEIFNCADYMIVGDGRVPLVKLIDYLNNKITISEVPNLIYKEDKELRVNPREHYPLEEIPVPDFDGLPLDSYRNHWMKGDYMYFHIRLQEVAQIDVVFVSIHASIKSWNSNPTIKFLPT